MLDLFENLMLIECLLTSKKFKCKDDSDFPIFSISMKSLKFLTYGILGISLFRLFLNKDL